jgi:hypothetical protein
MNATTLPSMLIAGWPLPPLPSTPALDRLTRTVVFRARSRTNTSLLPLRSFGTRLLADEANAMKRPLALTPGGPSTAALASTPAVLTFTRSVAPVLSGGRGSPVEHRHCQHHQRRRGRAADPTQFHRRCPPFVAARSRTVCAPGSSGIGRCPYAG